LDVFLDVSFCFVVLFLSLFTVKKLLAFKLLTLTFNHVTCDGLSIKCCYTKSTLVFK
jgi:hypothetical protein